MTLFFFLFIGAIMIALTVGIHAAVMDFIIRNVGKWEKAVITKFKILPKSVIATTVVWAVFLAHIIEIWLWAFLYYGLKCLPHGNFQEALYFSTVTYTTLGYGDIILPDPYRILSGVEAANGFLLFGWTTAFIFEVISRVYKHEIRSL